MGCHGYSQNTNIRTVLLVQAINGTESNLLIEMHYCLRLHRMINMLRLKEK